MANPRQRRKTRSSSHKPVHHSSRAKKLLRKQKQGFWFAAIRGPKVLQEAWQKTKTVRQNYEALGLVASLNPTLSGGVEPTTSRHDRADTRSIELSSTPEVSDTRKTARTQSVPRGFGRIIRDENGNVMDVDLGEDAEDVEESNNQLIEDIPHPATQEGAAGWISLGSNRPSSSKSVVQSLEGLSTSSNQNKTPRFSSRAEVKTLLRLIKKYNDDVDAMAQDRKLNVDQRTAGELRRAIQKAGGLAALQCDGSG
ncbi:hypothetical protein NLI96_g6389 [Meripilus lineatus]|uniref:Nucleolar protein 16 n=1 Tax=Meripilus lineatus TaxID=2056292 RepID=A0AAD5V3G3_9APHY|nr:hypothetical protein NLI96_g6389 [Physisporinus lineatus]